VVFFFRLKKHKKTTLFFLKKDHEGTQINLKIKSADSSPKMFYLASHIFILCLRNTK